MQTINDCLPRETLVADPSTSFSSGTSQGTSSFSSTNSGSSTLLFGEVESSASSQSSSARRPRKCTRYQSCPRPDSTTRLPASGFSPRQDATQDGNHPYLRPLPTHLAVCARQSDRALSSTPTPTPASVSPSNTGTALQSLPLLSASVYRPEKYTAPPSNRATPSLSGSRAPPSLLATHPAFRSTANKSHRLPSPPLTFASPSGQFASKPSNENLLQPLAYLPVVVHQSEKLNAELYSREDTTRQSNQTSPKFPAVPVSSSREVKARRRTKSPLLHLACLPATTYCPKQSSARSNNNSALPPPTLPSATAYSAERHTADWSAKRLLQSPVSHPQTPVPSSQECTSPSDHAVPLAHPELRPSSLFHSKKHPAQPRREVPSEYEPTSPLTPISSSSMTLPRQYKVQSSYRRISAPQKAELSAPVSPRLERATTHPSDGTMRPLQTVDLPVSASAVNSVAHEEHKTPTAQQIVRQPTDVLCRPKRPMVHPSDGTLPLQQIDCLASPVSPRKRPIIDPKDRTAYPQQAASLSLSVSPRKRPVVRPDDQPIEPTQIVDLPASEWGPKLIAPYPSMRIAPNLTSQNPVKATSTSPDVYKPRKSRSNDQYQAFVKVWFDSKLRNKILLHFPNPERRNKNFASLRVLCKDLSVRIGTYLFRRSSYTFHGSLFTVARLKGLTSLGKVIETLTLTIPHTDATFLKPVINHAGEEVKWTWDPEQYLASPPRAPKYGNDEVLSDLLVRQHEPIFHAACKVDRFIQFFSCLPNLKHLIMSCPANPKDTEWTFNRQSAVDHALTSLKLALEKNNLKHLHKLTLYDFHAPGVRYLSPPTGIGAGLESSEFRMRIKSLKIVMRHPLPKPGRKGQKEADAAYIGLVKTYIRSFTLLEELDFRWAGEKGPCPFPVEVSRLDTEQEKPLHLARLAFLRLANVEVKMACLRDIVELHIGHKQSMVFDFKHTSTIWGTLAEALEPYHELQRRLEKKKRNKERRNDPWAPRESLASNLGDLPIMLSPEAPHGVPLRKFRSSRLVRVDSVVSLPEEPKTPAGPRIPPPRRPTPPGGHLYGEIISPPDPPGPAGSAYWESVDAQARLPKVEEQIPVVEPKGPTDDELRVQAHMARMTSDGSEDEPFKPLPDRIVVTPDAVTEALAIIKQEEQRVVRKKAAKIEEEIFEVQMRRRRFRIAVAVKRAWEDAKIKMGLIKVEVQIPWEEMTPAQRLDLMEREIPAWTEHTIRL